MEIEVERWEAETFPNTKLMGRVKVLLNKKMFVWLNVIAGKNGNAFVTFPSFKSKDEKYLSYMGWPENEKMEKMIATEVLKILKERYSI